MKYINLFVVFFVLLLLHYAVFYNIPNQFSASGSMADMQRIIINRRIFLLSLIFLISYTYHKVIYKNKGNSIAYKSGSFSIIMSLNIFYTTELYFSFKTKSHAIGYSYAGKLWNIKYWNPMNDNGFRDVSFQHHPDNKTIFFIGDSFTEGHGIEDCRDRYSDIIRKALPQYNVYNLGVNGLGTQKELEILRLAPIKPNIVFWQYFSNDIDELLLKYGYHFSFEPYNDLNKVTKKIVKGSFFFNYIYWSMPRKDAQSYLVSLENGMKNQKLIREHLQNCDSIIDYCSSNNIKLVFICFPLFVADEKNTFNTHAKFMLDYVSSKSVEVVNVDSLTRNLKNNQKIVNNLDPHASKIVNKRIADFILKEIKF